VGLRKHGVGQIIEPESEQDLSKTASKDWSEEDEEDLAKESKE
jgi:hypothetical protein